MHPLKSSNCKSGLITEYELKYYEKKNTTHAVVDLPFKAIPTAIAVAFLATPYVLDIAQPATAVP